MTPPLGDGFRQMQTEPVRLERFLERSALGQLGPEKFDHFLGEARERTQDLLSSLGASNHQLAIANLCGEGVIPRSEAKGCWTDINDQFRLMLALRAEELDWPPDLIDRVLAHEPARGLGRLVKRHVDVALCDSLLDPEEDAEAKRESAVSPSELITIPKRLTIRVLQRFLRQLGFYPTTPTHTSKHVTWKSPSGLIFRHPSHNGGYELPPGYTSGLRRLVEQVEQS